MLNPKPLPIASTAALAAPALEPTATERESGLRHKLLQGFRYLAAGQLLGYGIRFISNLVLARLLAPDLFGLIAVASAFVYASVMLCDIGLRNAVIQDARAQHRRFRDVAWTMMSLRVLVFAGLISAALLGVSAGERFGLIEAGSVYADPRLPTALILLALAEAIRSLESVEMVYLERQMAFRRLFVLQTWRQAISTAVTVSWAAVDPGVMALCAGSLVANTVMLVVSYVHVAHRGPRWVWSPQDFRAIWDRGQWLLVSSILTFSMNALDRVWLASYFDAGELGLYSTAMIFGLLALEVVERAGASVIFPLLSERFRQGDTTLATSFYQARRMVLLVSAASGFFFIAFGDRLIGLLYDTRYHEAGQVLQAFGIVALLAVFTTSGEAYLAVNQARYKSIVYAVRVAALLGGLLMFVPDQGPVGGVWALAMSHACGAVVSLRYNRLLGILAWREELKTWAVLVAAGLGGLLIAQQL